MSGGDAPGTGGGHTPGGTSRRAGSFVSPEFRNRVRAIAVPVAIGLGHLGLTPNALTIVGFLGTCAAAVAAASQAWILAGILVLAFGIFDLFDGALARATGTASAFGAFLDSTLDRLGENVVLAGVVAGAAQAGFVLGAGLAALAMATASVVTYTRARAEAVGLHGEVGVAPRPERLVILSAGLVLTGVWGGLQTYAYLGCCWNRSPIYLNEADGSAWLAGSLALIVGTCAITIVQRIVHVHRQSTHQ